VIKTGRCRTASSTPFNEALSSDLDRRTAIATNNQIATAISLVVSKSHPDAQYSCCIGRAEFRPIKSLDPKAMSRPNNAHTTLLTPQILSFHRILHYNTTLPPGQTRAALNRRAETTKPLSGAESEPVELCPFWRGVFSPCASSLGWCCACRGRTAMKWPCYRAPA